MDDGDERVGQRRDVQHDEDERERHVNHDHHGNDPLGNARDALQSADDDEADDDRDKKRPDHGGDGVVHAKDAHGCRLVGVKEAGDCGVDGIDLRKRTNAEQADAHAEEREDLREPLPGNLGQALSHAALDVVERAAEHVAVLVDAAELHREQALGVFGRHAEQGGNPHPEHGARAAGDDCGRHADDVAGADGRGKGGAQSAERRHLAGRVLAFLVFQHVAQGARQLAELQAAQAHGQKNAAEQDEHHQGHAPDEVVDGIEHVVERAEEVFHCSSSISVTFRNFKRPSKRPWRTRAFRVLTRATSGMGATKGKGKAKCDTQMRQAVSFSLSFCLRVSTKSL